MKVILILAAILVAVFAESLTLTTADFDQTIETNNYVLAMFYAPCKYIHNVHFSIMKKSIL